jgi:two-component system, LytTR family, response regulator
LLFENIVRIEGKSNYSKIFFADNTHPLTVSKTLGWVEKYLPIDNFLRTHRTHIVNKQFIDNINIASLHVQLLNGEKISISRRRKMFMHEMIA